MRERLLCLAWQSRITRHKRVHARLGRAMALHPGYDIEPRLGATSSGQLSMGCEYPSLPGRPSPGEMMMPCKQSLLRGGFIVAGMLSATPAPAADFYTGKTIDLIVSNAPGGGF